MFLSMVWGILNIGDTRQLGTIGKQLLSRFLLISTVFGVVCLAAALLVFRPRMSGAQSGQAVIQSVIEMLLDIITGNIVEPVLTGNTLQILFMGAVVGVVMLILRERAQVLTQAVEQANALVQTVLSVISSLTPGFIFLSVLRLILQGTLVQSAAGLLKAIVLSVALTAVEIIVETLSLMKQGVSPAQAVKKLSAPFLIALTTASSAAAFPQMMDCCHKKLGVEEKLANFALPFGSVVFMPHAVNLFIIVPLFATQIYDVELTAGSLILCVINAVILSVAAPPIPGGAISCYTLMLLQLGVPLEAISLAAAANVVLDFTATGGNLYALLVQLTHGAKNLHMLDETVLYRPE
jgi:Na+/H+-dicarboxylate symporter